VGAADLAVGDPKDSCPACSTNIRKKVKIVGSSDDDKDLGKAALKKKTKERGVRCSRQGSRMVITGLTIPGRGRWWPGGEMQEKLRRGNWTKDRWASASSSKRKATTKKERRKKKGHWPKVRKKSA